MAKIVINIDMEELKSGVNQMFDDDQVEEFSCPLVTEDEEENSENKQYAIDEFAYGPSSKNWEKKPEKCVGNYCCLSTRFVFLNFTPNGIESYFNKQVASS